MVEQAYGARSRSRRGSLLLTRCILREPPSCCSSGTAAERLTKVCCSTVCHKRSVAGLPSNAQLCSVKQCSPHAAAHKWDMLTFSSESRDADFQIDGQDPVGPSPIAIPDAKASLVVVLDFQCAAYGHCSA